MTALPPTSITGDFHTLPKEIPQLAPQTVSQPVFIEDEQEISQRVVRKISRKTAQQPPSGSAQGALLRLPVCVRLVLVRFALWRARHRSALKTVMLAVSLAVFSGALGFLLSQPEPELQMNPQPGLGAALPDREPDPSRQAMLMEARRWGQLQAEVLRLRLLFSRIVEAADLGDAEFALVAQLSDERYLESLLSLEDTPEAAQQRFELAKYALNHMTSQAGLMLSISRQRHQERRFTLSGSPVVRAHITSLYGFRTDPRSGRRRFHRGADFGGRHGSKVLALADGVVTYSGKNGGYGNLVELEHTDGYRTRYAHNEENLVKVGRKVSKGEVIATMGSTGRSTGTHVHVEVRHEGRAVDPLQFLSAGS